MKNGIFTIARKEFARFFRDRRMVITTIFMPGILIYLIYSLMGSGMAGLFGSDENTPYTVYAENLPDSVGAMIAAAPMLEKAEYPSKEDALAALEREECDLVLTFDEGFDLQIAAALRGEEVTVTPPTLHYYSAKTRSQEAYSTVLALLSAMEAELNPPLIDLSESSSDLSSEEDVMGMIYSMMLPMLLMAMLFSGCMAVAPESIAGEKERGTVATMLVTPLQRSHLAIGKILSLSAIALLSGLSSTVGILLALPKLMGDEMGDGNVFAVLSVPDILSLAAVILSSVLVIVSLVAIVSAYAKSVKEASTYTAPLMIVVMLLGVTTMFSSGALPAVAYMIPLFNSVNCIAGIFGGNYSYVFVLITTFANLAVMGLLTYALTLMFNHERMISDKG